MSAGTDDIDEVRTRALLYLASSYLKRAKGEQREVAWNRIDQLLDRYLLVIKSNQT